MDIDPAELQKPLVKPDLAVNADLREFFPALAERLGAFRAGGEWTQYCRRMRSKYAFENVPEYRQEDGAPVNVYNLTRTLTSIADPDDIFVVANGSPCICTCQCAVTKKGQRMFLNSGDASMGYDLPAAIGAAVANPGKKVICYTGDGSIMMNLQELQTIKTHNLPIRIFIIRNDGYSSIKQTHKNFFNARYVGCNAASGVETPDFREVAKAFGIESERIETGDGLADRLKAALERRGPFVCEIVCQDDYMFSPKLSAKQMPGRLDSLAVARRHVPVFGSGGIRVQHAQIGRKNAKDFPKRGETSRGVGVRAVLQRQGVPSAMHRIHTRPDERGL